MFDDYRSGPFVAGLLVFTASSPVAGSALMPNLARLVQGAGAALLLPSALVLVTASAADERARHRSPPSSVVKIVGVKEWA